jgi:hypothetical protein
MILWSMAGIFRRASGLRLAVATCHDMFPEAYEPIDPMFDGNFTSTKMLHRFNSKRTVILREHALARCFEQGELPFPASGTGFD